MSDRTRVGVNTVKYREVARDELRMVVVPYVGPYEGGCLSCT